MDEEKHLRRVRRWLLILGVAVVLMVGLAMVRGKLHAQRVVVSMAGEVLPPVRLSPPRRPQPLVPPVHQPVFVTGTVFVPWTPVVTPQPAVPPGGLGIG